MGPVSVGIQEAYQNSGAGAADEADFWAIATQQETFQYLTVINTN